MSIEISANSRKLHGTGANRRLRIQGRLPGVIYGGGGATQSIDLDHKDLYYKLKTDAFHASILSIDVDGKKEQVLLRDVQMHPFKQQVLHIDFQRIKQDQKINVKIPLNFINADVAPGVKLSGGIISHVATEIEISCLPKDLPESITVDLSEMVAGSTIHTSDLNLPENVEIPALLRGDNQPISSLIVPRGGETASESDEESA
ncbi:50S ribosomal protein L25/general stress protein Ctc [Nitrosomonas sp. HPC101]|uniref:50S ribosomal protein L25/general stress protein Ctc n=1 Tax=Nitrosomonas sp. HPC101 TaxID=1658667 RepID=UPI00136BE754|nr:50S ribosomal protein L25/general stress protein Ctc [Nitrosomonas sp. HPC101]MXS85343.1 50S ribosomal protein L25/general stress protein Ctc [Nitrosomonas sp. HPC101]